MFVSIKPSGVKKSAMDLREINKRLKTASLDVSTVSRDLSFSSSSYSTISGSLATQVRSLNALITTLASMEDGLEKAVELYLQCEKSLSDKITQASSSGAGNFSANASISGTIKNWWSNLTDWFETGVWRNPDKADRIRNDKAMAAELRKILKSDRYSKATWKKASVTEREQILRELFTDMQKIYGVSLNTILIESIPSDPGYVTYGYYQDEYRLVCINSDLLADESNYSKIMDTMTHEMRHAYQKAVVRNPEDYQVDAMTVEEWRENFNDYKRTEDDGYEAYRDQPVEKDARKFASWVI